MKPEVVWMGDSTVLARRGTSYPQILGGGVPEATWMVMGTLGADFFTYYPLVGELLARHRPSLLVLVAHLRQFADPREEKTATRTTRNDLLSMVPLGELPRAMSLPLAARDATVPRLLLARLLRFETMERALYVVDGAHALVAEADVPSLGPLRPSWPLTGLRMRHLILAGSDVPVTARHPTVRMMEATVRLAREAGVAVIVVGSPIPFEAMRQTVGYDEDLYRARFEMLQVVVENAGGTFVDLHEALPAGRFQDSVGHFDAQGAQMLAERLRAIVVRESGTIGGDQRRRPRRS